MFSAFIRIAETIVEGCSAYAERGLIINLSYPASCRMKGLGTIPHLCGVSLFVLFCSAFNSLLGLYIF